MREESRCEERDEMRERDGEGGKRLELQYWNGKKRMEEDGTIRARVFGTGKEEETEGKNSETI